MADIYGVIPADVAGELPGLYPGGFTANTKPTTGQVTAWISTADAIVSLKVQDIAGAAPAVTDKAAVLAKRYIVEWTKAQTMRTAFVGNDPDAVEAAARPFQDAAAQMLDALTELGAQAEGTGEAEMRVAVPYTVTQRELLVSDEQLDNDEGNRERRY